MWTKKVNRNFILLCISLLLPTSANAQEQEATTAEPPKGLPEIVISASPLPRSLFEQAQAVGVLSGEELNQSASTSLGDALATQAGVASSSFGAGASRPVIRGQGGERIRILQNGVGTLDASNASPDHAVSVEPSQVQRIEVVRGPATLLYGTNAVGGVVNVIDGRIPEELPEKVEGNLNLRGSTVDSQGATAAGINAPIGNFAVHLDGSFRDAGDYRIPNFARTQELRDAGPPEEGEEARRRLPFSASQSESASVGSSYILDDGGFLGLSGTLYNSNYGLPNGEPDVSINLKQRRLDSRGRFNEPVDWLRGIEYRLGWVNYEHTEFEGGEPGTVFQNDAVETRVQLDHEEFLGAQGAFGLQYQYSDFAAIGEEAFQPPTTTNIFSGFVFEEFEVSPELRYQIGGRLDSQSVHAVRLLGEDANGQDQTQNFFTLSGSTGVVWTPYDEYAAALSLTHTERAPLGQELFARGPHIATGAFEIGDSNLDTEKSLGLDLTFRKRSGWVTGSLSGFANEFQDYIALFPTGEEADGLGVYEFRAVDALFTGFESQTAFHLFGPKEDHALRTKAEEISGKSGPSNPGGHDELDLTMQWDYVRAKNRDAGGALPRITPLRGLFGLEYQRGGFFTRAEVQHVFRQTRVAALESETPGYTVINARISQKLAFELRQPAEVFLRADNLFNEEMRNHVSFIKDVAPLPGRNFVLGLQMYF